MRKTTCTAFTNPPARCGRVDDCTLVLVENARYDTRGRAHPIRQYVCAACRKRMRLPDHDCRVTRRGVVKLTTR